MSKNNFNGWTNQAALDINFHVHNDQVACSAKDELIRLQRRPISGLDVRRLVRDYLANVHRELLTSPKGSGNSIEDINWDEIACVWEAERRSNRSSSITQCLQEENTIHPFLQPIDMPANSIHLYSILDQCPGPDGIANRENSRQLICKMQSALSQSPLPRNPIQCELRPHKSLPLLPDLASSSASD